MDTLRSVQEGVEKSDVFESWKKEHGDAYLAHIFVLLDTPVTYQIGYFDPGTKQITSFHYSDGAVSALPPSPIFQEEEREILSLDMENVSVSGDDALATARAFQKEQYPQHLPMKTFFILQHLPLGILYNVTFVTQSFQTLNIKIDATTGELLKHSLDKLIDVVK